MKKRNYMVRILAAAMAVSLIAGCGGTSGTPQSSASAGSAQPVADGGPAAGAPAETYTLRFATGHQETDPTFQEAVKWGESVKEKTGGAVVIECYADGVLGTPEDIHEDVYKRQIQSIPLSMIRLSFRGRPRFLVSSGGSSGLMRSHCSFVNSYRFMLLASHNLASCATFIFQTRPRPMFFYSYILQKIIPSLESTIFPKLNIYMESRNINSDCNTTVS